eukprot:12539_1
MAAMSCRIAKWNKIKQCQRKSPKIFGIVRFRENHTPNWIQLAYSNRLAQQTSIETIRNMQRMEDNLGSIQTLYRNTILYREESLLWPASCDELRNPLIDMLESLEPSRHSLG